MPKAKTRPAPRWRTAPGLGQDPTPASDDAPALGSVVRTRSGRDDADTDRALPPPPPLSPRSATPFAAAAEVDGSAENQPVDPGVPPGDEAREQQGTRAAPTLSPLARQPAETASELASPQVRMDAELPVPGRAEPRNTGEPDSGARRTALARYGAAEQAFTRSVRSLEPISDQEAAAFAGRFAADFQSFDEDNPSRRAEVLRSLLADPQACTWGWSGAGRQRADSPLPGRIYRSSETVVFVEVIVRATTYTRACPSPEPPEHRAADGPEPPGAVGPSCAPSESDPGWAAAETNWLRMTVPITRDSDDGRLVVDPHLVSDHSS